MSSCHLSRSIVNVDCLLDAVQALVSDCDHPAIRKIKNIDAFVNRCKYSDHWPGQECSTPATNIPLQMRMCPRRSGSGG